MNTILGANWRTTLSGWIAVIASAIAINPSLVAFLPEASRNYVTGIAGILAVVSGGAFAAQAKDKCVTGGSVLNDQTQPPQIPAPNDPVYQAPTRRIAPLIVAALLPLFALSGCAWVQTHRSQIDATLSVVSARALAVAERVLISVATWQRSRKSGARTTGSRGSSLPGISEPLRATHSNRQGRPNPQSSWRTSPPG